MRLGTGPPAARAGRGGGEGVRTRDHLANVRTFLAWVRAALALVTLGYVVDKFDLVTSAVHGRTVPPVGAADKAVALTVTGSGVVLVAGAFVRFMIARRMIDREELRPRPLLDAMLVVVAAGAGFLILGYLIRQGG